MYLERKMCVQSLHIVIQIKGAAWFSLAEFLGEPLLSFLLFLLELMGLQIILFFYTQIHFLL